MKASVWVVLLLLDLLLATQPAVGYPHNSYNNNNNKNNNNNNSNNGDNRELVVVVEAEVVRSTNADKNASAPLFTVDRANTGQDNESVMATEDDLIFLAKASNEASPGGARTYSPRAHDSLLNCAEEDSLAPMGADAAATNDHHHHYNHDDDDDDDDEDENYEEGVPREIELHTEGMDGAPPLPPMTSAIDLSQLVALLPVAEVKGIVANYYRQDAEVRRAHAFVNSSGFVALRRHLLTLPEIASFFRYVNESGVDLLQTLTLVARLIKSVPVKTPDNTNEIQHSSLETLDGLPSASSTETSATTPRTTSAQTKGLPGLLVRVLSVLPHDEIKEKFFDKVKETEQFSMLVERLGSPEFTRILGRLETSSVLQNLAFVLKNNGINIKNIAEVLRDFFVH